MREAANVNSSLSVCVAEHRRGYEDYVREVVTIYIHGTDLCPKICTTLDQ